jgi:hypothetical protein
MFQNLARLALLVAIIATSGCTNSLTTSQPLAEEAVVKTVGEGPSVGPEGSVASIVEVTLTLNRSQLFDREYLYSSDIQYSSIYNADYDLYTQSLAMSHIPARFRISGNELQLIADNEQLYPSDVNNPEQLLSRMQIIRQTSSTITVSGLDSRLLLGQRAETASAPIPRDHWIRSFRFEPNGNYLLQETSVLLANGSIVEFFESVFPRGSIAPSARFEKIEMNPESPDGELTGLKARFRFLPGESTYDGERKRAFAEHFDIHNADGTMKPIEWWVTRNIPEEYMEPVKHATESWNRYYRNFEGVRQDVVIFKGRLPADVKIGDPRYNVINWDSRRVAGAAYESQASDPLTGKQSHSLIYMPAAWLEIGESYWERAQTAAPDLHQRRGAFKNAHVGCMKEFVDEMRLLNSGRLAPVDPKEFGIELMKSTLMHEVGHALGLAHNFKGSLSFDRSNPRSPYSDSIMDYNHFELERAAFYDPTTADGLALEYDRQILSVLYNAGRDIRPNDRIVPVCNDDEADFNVGAVDPLCVRYDIENEPTLSVVTALRRLTDVTLPGDITLKEALERVPNRALTQSRMAAAIDQESFAQLTSDTVRLFRAPLEFYIGASRSSLGAALRTNAKSLLPFLPDVLRAQDSERLIRERIFSGIQTALQLRALPAVSLTAAQQVRDELVNRLAQTPYMVALDSTRAAAQRASLVSRFDRAISTLENDDSFGFARVQARALSALVRTPTAPLFLGEVDGVLFDFETAGLSLLKSAVLDATRTAAVRIAGTDSLVSYRGRVGAAQVLSQVNSELRAQLTAARSMRERELLETLLGKFNRN